MYHPLDGALQQVSEDHVVGGYMLTKCLGGTSLQEPVEPFAQLFSLLPNSRFLLCSDGITDELTDAHTHTCYRPDRRPTPLCRRL